MQRQKPRQPAPAGAVPGIGDDVGGSVGEGQACPDHEKLHQRLMEACELAAREPRKRKPAVQVPDDLDDLDEGRLSSED